MRLSSPMGLIKSWSKTGTIIGLFTLSTATKETDEHHSETKLGDFEGPFPSAVSNCFREHLLLESQVRRARVA